MIKAFLLVLAIVVLCAGIVTLRSDVAYAGNGKPGGSCPSGTGCGCSTAFAPVICGKQKCKYLNMCVASCSGWTSSQCVDGNPN